MKKALALILTVLLTLSLVACGDNASMPNSDAVTPPSTAEPTAGPLQGDVGSPRTEGDAHTFGQPGGFSRDRPNSGTTNAPEQGAGGRDTRRAGITM